MRTWEMIKELTENPEKKFKEKSFGQVEIFEGELVWSSNMDIVIISEVVLGMEWEEVKEPVDFMTAFKAFREGKAISVEDGELTGGRFTYYPRTNERYVAFSEEDIANGKWYIED